MKVLTGADPEVFLKDNGRYVSAHGMIPGTKKNPFRVNKGAVQVDGMALEFNIEPAEDEEQFITNIDTVMAELRRMVPGVEIAIDPVAEFTREYLDQQPMEAKELGCDPDFNAWTGCENPKPDEEALFRGGAGHVHCGWLETPDEIDEGHDTDCRVVVKQLDFYLGLPSLLFDPETRRREAYGKAGAYRPKPYGVEYRVLSNKWLCSDKLKRWVYRNTQAAIKRLDEVQLCEKYGDIQDIINTSDIKRAIYICDREGIEIPQVEVKDVG